MKHASLLRGLRGGARAQRLFACLFAYLFAYLFACLFACLLGGHWGMLAHAEAPTRPGSAPSLGEVPWVVTAGTRAPVQGTVRCVPVSAQPQGRSAQPGAALRADAMGYCSGTVRFSYEALWYLSVRAADIDGVACTFAQWFVACPVLLAVGQSALVTTELDAGPYARGTSEVAVGGVDPPVYQGLEFRTEGGLTVSQPPALVVSGVERSGATQLRVQVDGPSGARDVQVIEQLPPLLSVSSDSPICHFDSLQSRLACSWPNIDPGTTVSVPIQISAPTSFPTSQVGSRLQASSDLGSASASASIVVSGSLVAGEQSLRAPARVVMGSILLDNVSLHVLPGAAGAQPPPGIPASWTVSFSPGLQVQGVTPAQDSLDMACSYGADTVTCSAPHFANGEAEAGANASIQLSAVQTGRQTATLKWASTQGAGSSSVSVQVYWDEASQSGQDAPEQAPSDPQEPRAGQR